MLQTVAVEKYKKNFLYVIQHKTRVRTCAREK